MRYTNKLGLPEEIFFALTKQRYEGGSDTDYSVTTLKSPPQQVQLLRRHADELEEDAVDNLWSLFGNMAHKLLEEHGSEESLTEERLKINILDRVVSGQVDHYKDGIITDYKITSAYTLVYGSRLKEWEEQLNMYAQIFKQHNYSVRQIRIVAILRDWDKNKALQGGNYPNAPIQIIPITLWSDLEQEAYLYERVILHKDAEELEDSKLPPCTDEEMWAKPTTYAVMKEGRKTAVRVLNSKEEADEYIRDTDYTIEKREGKRQRCSQYCAAASFCNQWKGYNNES